MQKYYKAEMDRLLRITTRLVYLVFCLPPALLAVIYYQTRCASPHKPMPPAVQDIFLLVSAVVVVVFAASAYFTRKLAPKGFALDDVALTIDRDLKPITIPLREILSVSRHEENLRGRALRLMGASGYYGHYGLFWAKGLGQFRLYATRLNDLVAVKTEKTLYLLSPEDPAVFTADLQSLLRR